MIKDRHIPHYIIESRNLFNSKMTEKMSMEIVDVLSKYDTTHVSTLNAFENVFQLTQYDDVLLKHETLTSTIIACLNACITTFNLYVFNQTSPWHLYLKHNATKSVLNYEKILQKLKQEKGVTILYAKYLFRSMLGFLYYVKYKETNKADFLLASKRLITKSLNLDTSCVKLRGATFFLTKLEYSQSIEVCDTFLTFPPRCEMNSYVEYTASITKKLFDQVFKVKRTEEIENVMKAILRMFYCSVKLKSLPENYDIAQQNLAWIFRNLTNI